MPRVSISITLVALCLTLLVSSTVCSNDTINSHSQDTFSQNLFSLNDFTSYINNQKSSFLCGACNVGANIVQKTIQTSVWLIEGTIKLGCG